jgi:PQQ-like domain/FG-GAP-like repeat
MKKFEIGFVVCSAVVSLVLIVVSVGYGFQIDSIVGWFEKFTGRDTYPLIPVAVFPIADEVDYRDYCIGDTDGDGIPERWVYHSDHSVSWVSAYENQGQNRYSEVFRSEELNRYPLAAGDIDQDGLGDLFIQNSYQILWYEADTPGGFPSQLVTTLSIDHNDRGSAQLADLDGDGWDELVVACYSLDIYKCTGNNELEEQFTTYQDFTEIEIDDFDLDGVMEIAAIARYDGLFIYSMENLGVPTLEYSDDQGSHYCMTAGDVDQDGKPELFGVVSGHIQVWESYGADLYAPTTNVAYSTEDCVTADLKGDGSSQLIVYGTDGNGHIFEAVSDDVYGEVDDIPVGQFGEDVIAHDFNKDGKDELIFDVEGYAENAHAFLFQWDSDPDQDPWPMYRHDASRSGAGNFVGPNSAREVWSIAFTEEIKSSPVVNKEGQIFFTTDTGVKMLYKDGSPGWSVSDENNFSGEPVLRPTGGVVAVDINGYLRAFNCLGDEDWVYDTVQAIESDLVSDSQGTLYAGTVQGNFLSVSAAGSLRWVVNIGSPVMGGAVISRDEMSVIFATQDGYARSLDVAQGTQNWDVNLEEEIGFGPSQDPEGNTYWVTASGRIISLDADGTFRWEYIVNKAPAGPLVIHEESVFFVSEFDTTGTLIALNTDGVPQWVKSGAEFGGAPIVADGFGNLYSGNPDGTFHVYNADGEFKWSVEMDHPVVRTAAFTGRGEVVVTDTGNTLKAFGFGLKPTPTAVPPSTTGTPRPTPTAHPATPTATPYPTYPPRTRNPNPGPNQTDVLAYTDVYLEVYDPEEGVDPDSIRLWVNGFAVQPELQPIYKGYSVTYNNPGIFDFDELVEIHFTASDNCYPPNTIDPPLVYSFRIESDHYTPYIGDMLPMPGAIDVEADTPLTFEIMDDGDTGVDPDSIEIEIDGVVYRPEIEEKYYIYRKGYLCSFLPQGGWPYNQSVSGIIRGQDMHNPPNVMEEVPFQFTTVNPAPSIWMAGYGNLRVTTSEGGTMQMLAWVVDHGQDLVKVEVVYQGWETGIALFDDGQHGDGAANDGIWGFQAPIPAGMVADKWMLELKATDALGKESTVWPYLTVNGGDGLPPPRWGQSGQPDGGSVSNGPSILYAGYMDTRLTSEQGGELTIVAMTAPGESGYPIDSVELFYGPLPTGVLLYDDGAHQDFAAGDGIYGYSVEIGPNLLEPGSFELNLIASDTEGNRSAPWPYFVIYPE